MIRIQKFSLSTERKNGNSLVLNFMLHAFNSGIQVAPPVNVCDAQRKKVVAEAKYMCNVAKQHRYLTTTKSKGYG